MLTNKHLIHEIIEKTISGPLRTVIIEFPKPMEGLAQILSELADETIPAMTHHLTVRYVFRQIHKKARTFNLTKEAENEYKIIKMGLTLDGTR